MENRKRSFHYSGVFIALMWIGQLNLSAQTLFKFGSEEVSASEFERVFMKNNPKKDKPDVKSIEEYLELYINFKLKVQEAKSLGLDTLSSFKQELTGYRKQLAQPYLNDKSVTEGLVKEAFDRLQWEIGASHILVFCEEDALPKDTMAAWKRIQEIRSEVMQKSEPFDSIAFRKSEDPSARYNYGNLGYFTTFNLIYPFETEAYNTQVGEVSQVFRTRFGYHLLRVNDRRPARGEVKVAIIRIKAPMDETAARQAKQKTDSIYQRLKKGESFEELAKKFSEDETARNGGVLNPIASLGGPWPSEFKDAAFALKSPGDISEPIKTATEWLIIKLIEKKAPPSFEQSREALKQKVQRDMRSELNRKVVLERLKTENGLKENKKNLDRFIQKGYADSSLLRGMYTPDLKKEQTKPLFSIKEKKYTYQDFAKYLGDYQNPRPGQSLDGTIRKMYKDFVEASLLSYEEEHLEEKYPEFRFLFKEYHDGILLFDLTDKKVWSKAVSDTSGLRAYYEKNIEKYQWKERVDVTFYTARNEAVAAQLKKLLNTDSTTAQIVTTLNNADPLNVTVKEAKFEKGDAPDVDEAIAQGWGSNPSPGLKEFKNPDGSVRICIIRELVKPGPKKITEAKGIITSDYQGYLEKEWIKELKLKYPVDVNQEVKSKLFSN